MRKTTLAFVLVLLCVAVAGCAKMVAPSQEQQAAAYYGPYPENYEQIVKDGMTTQLYDPYSAQYIFQGSPQKGYITDPPLAGGGTEFGWQGTVLINAKNRMGGYVGARPYTYIIRDGSLVKMSGGVVY